MSSVVRHFNVSPLFRRSRSWKTEADRFEARIIDWMARNATRFTRISIGLIFFWFGSLKLVPGLSPAESLAGHTLSLLSGGILTPSVGISILGVWETAMGMALLSGRYLRLTLLLVFVHMAGTITPVFVLPGEVFAQFPFVLTLTGQYIVKNLVLISGAIVVGANLRSGRGR